MATVTKLSRSLVEDAAAAEHLRYEIDNDGDIHFIVSRRKGKDLNIYISVNEGEFLMYCIVSKWFGPNHFAKLLVVCNEWNRSQRFPTAWVSTPDSDGDYRVLTNHTIFCRNGIHRELIQQNLSLFLGACEKLWDVLDEEV